MKTLSRPVQYGLLGVLLCAAPGNAGVLLFDQATDTIRAGAGLTLGQTSTIEAVVGFTPAYSAAGVVFNEWTDGAEDKALGVGPNDVVGFAYPRSFSFLSTSTPVALNTWHHIAFVTSASMDLLFLDGVLVASRANSAHIGNSSGLPHIGAIFRDNAISGSMIGYMSAVRVSNSARYTTNFAPSFADFSADANTLLLYNFTEGMGNVVNDLSGNGNTGTFASGFNGATSPSWGRDPFAVPEPGTAFGAALGLAALAVWRRKTAKAV